MLDYLARRLAVSALVLLLVSLIVFAGLRFLPGDPARVLAGTEADDAGIQEIRERYGLDRPIPVQYASWLGQVLQGRLGESIRTRDPVVRTVGQKLPITLQLALLAMLVAAGIGIPMGVLSAVRRDTVVDYLGMFLATIGQATPVYWLGLMLLNVFADRLGWFPIGDYVEIGVGGPVAWAWHLALPWLTLALLYAGWYARMTRVQMLDVMRLDYVRTAWAKGLPPRLVVTRHVLRNALLPLATMLGMDVAYLMGGAVLTESVFGIPGIGGLAWRAIRMRDLPMVMGTVLFAAAFITLASLVVDLAYRALDPRIRTAG
jgi:peptide/nickel transport system permease protein